MKTRFLKAADGCRTALASLRSYPIRLEPRARVQLACEAGLAAVVRDSVRHIPPSLLPAITVAPSEYFSLGAGVSEALKGAGVPWITVQHGAVNVTYGPSVADEYWVWSERAAVALQPLLHHPVPKIRIVGPLRLSQTPSPPPADGRGRADGANRNLVVFTQGHGLEHARSIQVALAQQLRDLAQREGSVSIIVKTHPSEDPNMWKDMLAGCPRVTVVDHPMDIADLASHSWCCVALDSTALLEVMLAGTLAVQVASGDSIVVQPVAMCVVAIQDLAEFLSRLMADPGNMACLLESQRENLPTLVGDLGATRDRHAEALRDQLAMRRLHTVAL